MRLRVAALAAVTLYSAFAAPSSGEAEEPAPLRVARLITQLGSDIYTIRTQATEDLTRLGAEARRELEVAATSPDPEVRLRAKELLVRLRTAQIWEAARVEGLPAQANSTQLLNLVGERTGNRLLLGDQFGSFKERNVTLANTQGEFWPLLDDICRQGNYRIRTHFDSRQPGLVVVEGPATKFPIAYAGPIRGAVVGARRVFTEELNYEDLDSETTHTFQLNVLLMWEDRFRLVAYRSQPELVSARTDAGVELAATSAPSSSWNVAGPNTRQLSMTLKLHPPSTQARELDTLKLKWGLVAVGDHATLEVDRLNSPEPRFQEDVELVVEQVASSPGQRCEITAVVTRSLAPPEPQEILFQENELELVDTAGRPYRKQGQTNSLADNGGARLKATFIGEAEDSVPGTLRLTYPRIRAQRDVEIVFRHVPLPVAKPE